MQLEIFQKMVESVKFAMILVSHDGKIKYANRCSEELFGYSIGEMLEQNVEILVPKRFRENHPLYRASYMKLPKNKAMGEGRELYGLRVDGTEFPAEIGLIPIRVVEGLFVLVSVIDITERKMLTGNYFSQPENQSYLQKVNKELSEFSQIVSHDLNDPLNKILCLLKEIEQKTEKIEVKSLGESCLFYVNKAKDLIKNLLIYAQTSSVVKTPVDLSVVVKEIVDSFYNKAQFVIGNLPTIECDAVLIRQVFTNLIRNAVEYSGELRTVEIGQKDKIFFVKDNGRGIENTATIFKPFVKGKNSTGSGLGLSICKKIVESHQGKIWLESQKDFGTTFYFTLA